MIQGLHFEDEELIEILSSDPVRNEHLAACDECGKRLASFRMIGDALRQPSVWDDRPLAPEPVASTVAMLRAHADQMTAEDAFGAAAVEEMLQRPRDRWGYEALPRLAGTVRKLIEASEKAIDTLPADAVAIAFIATELAGSLDPASYAPDTVARLRGAAWRQRAYALFYTGSFADAEAAVRTAEEHLGECAVADYDLARVGIVSALVDRGLEKFDSAVQTARASAVVFGRYEDDQKLASAVLTNVHLLFSRNEFASALVELERMLAALSPSDARTRAIVLGNLGYGLWKTGRRGEALQRLEAAAVIESEIGMHGDAVRSRWAIAAILAEEGRLDDALLRFREVSAAFQELGMSGAAALASLDIAEALLMRGEDFAVVERICTEAMRSFERSGLAHTARALTAIALLSEAARTRTASPKLVRHVREYLRRLPDEPNLLFALPPD